MLQCKLQNINILRAVFSFVLFLSNFAFTKLYLSQILYQTLHLLSLFAIITSVSLIFHLLITIDVFLFPIYLYSYLHSLHFHKTCINTWGYLSLSFCRINPQNITKMEHFTPLCTNKQTLQKWLEKNRKLLEVQTTKKRGGGGVTLKKYRNKTRTYKQKITKDAK